MLGVGGVKKFWELLSQQMLKEEFFLGKKSRERKKNPHFF
jgi:hypothetical protein